MSGKKKIEEKEREGIVVKFKRKDTCGFKKGHKYCVNIIEPKGNGIVIVLRDFMILLIVKR